MTPTEPPRRDQDTPDSEHATGTCTPVPDDVLFRGVFLSSWWSRPQPPR